MNTPRCDKLALEHRRIMAPPYAPGVIQDWIALAQKLECELQEAQKACVLLTEAEGEFRKVPATPEDVAKLIESAARYRDLCK